MLNVSKVGNVKFEKCKIIDNSSVDLSIYCSDCKKTSGSQAKKHCHRRFCLDFARNREGTEPLQ